MNAAAIVLLATEALESPEAARVLHDALLERYGARYATFVREASKDADAFHECVEVRADVDMIRMFEQSSARTRRLLRPIFYRRPCDSDASWTPRTVVTFVAEPRWRPRAAIVFDGTRRAYDPAAGVIALRGRPHSQTSWLEPSTGRPIASPELRHQLDAALVRRVRTELVRRWSNDRLRSWLQWNDRNSNYRGANRREMIDDLMEIVVETAATPEEIRGSSWRDPGGRR